MAAVVRGGRRVGMRARGWRVSMWFWVGSVITPG